MGDRQGARSSVLASPDQLADRPHLELPDLGRIEHVQKRLEPQIVRPEVSIAEAVDERNAGSQDQRSTGAPVTQATRASSAPPTVASPKRARRSSLSSPATTSSTRSPRRRRPGRTTRVARRGPPAEPIGGTRVAPEPGRQVLPFGGGEGQLVLRHLDQLVAGSQVGEGDRRRLTARQEEVSVGWQPPQEVAEETCRGRINRDLVNVVDDQADVER